MPGCARPAGSGDLVCPASRKRLFTMANFMNYAAAAASSSSAYFP